MSQAAGAGTLGARLRLAARDAFGTPAFGGLLGCCLVMGLASSFVLPFLSLWGTQAVGMSAPLFATFMTVNALCGLTASTLLARQSDTRWSRRSVLLIGGSGGALGYIGYAFVREPLLLMAIGACLHSLSAVSFSQIFAHAREELARSVRPERASFALGVLRAAFSLSWTVGPALGALLLEAYGYRGTFLAAAGLLALYLTLVLASVPARLPEGKATLSRREPLWRLLARPQLLVNFSAFVLIFSAVSLNMMNLPLLLTQDLGSTKRQVGTAFVVAPVLEVPFMLWLGRMPHARHAFLIRSGVAVGILYFLALGWAQAPQHVYLAQVLNAFTVAVTMSLAIGYFQDLLPGQTGLATSVYTSSWSVGSLVAYFCFGVLAERLGHRGLTHFCVTLAGVSFLVLLVAGRRAPQAARSVEQML
jgi:SET family sugar efflux transporter-like MFS transporter